MPGTGNNAIVNLSGCQIRILMIAAPFHGTEAAIRIFNNGYMPAENADTSYTAIFKIADLRRFYHLALHEKFR